MLATARQTLNQAVARYSAVLQGTPGNSALAHKSALKTGLNQLQSLNTKLEANRLNVAVFGLVSRGKSAIINALVGENAVETGPIHGVTRWPRSVYWQIPAEAIADSGQPWQIELVDTPGLDEVGGEVRSDMSQTVAQQADLILFVVAGEITQKEYDALAELKRQQKPLLLVFNKTDLYPEVDRQAVYDTLDQLKQKLGSDPKDQALAIDEVVMVAASPAPVRVRVEWPDGRIYQEWETPAPQIAPLTQALMAIIRQDGAALVALNTLRQAHAVEQTMVSHVSALHGDQADDLIWQFAKYKAIAVALNPVTVLDVLGGIASDLVMIRNLAPAVWVSHHQLRSRSALAEHLKKFGVYFC